MALAARGEPIDGVWIRAAGILESDVVLADHAYCRSDDWPLVLVGQRDDGLGHSRRPTARELLYDAIVRDDLAHHGLKC